MPSRRSPRRRAGPAGADQPHPMPARREPAEDLEQVDLGPARVRILQVLPVDHAGCSSGGSVPHSRPSAWAMPSSTPLTKPGAPRPAEPVGQPDRLVDRHLGRHFSLAQLEDRRAGGCCARPRPCGSAASSPTPAPPRRRATRPPATTPLASASARSSTRGSGPVSRAEAGGELGHRRMAAQLPGVEQLERAGPALGLNPAASPPPQLRHDVRG